MANILDNLNDAFNTLLYSVHDNLPFLAGMLAVLWAIQALNVSLGYRLNRFGIYPRKIISLPGIFLSPFLHGSVQHLFFNSIPLFVLSALLLVNGKTKFFTVTLWIMLFSGLAVWLTGRRAFHVGASGIIMGYWGFLLFNAYQERSVMAIMLAFLCLYYFGGLMMHLFPSEEKVSWEGHVFGFFSGILTSYGLIAFQNPVFSTS